MPGLTINSNAMDTALDLHREQLRTYMIWNQRDGAELFVDEMRKMATELYNQTAAIAPTKGEITSDVRKQGWAIPRKFPDGRLGRGVPRQWQGVAWQKLKQKVWKKRGRPRNGEKTREYAAEDEFFAQKPTLAMMQAFVIKIRNAARLYLASGWLGAILDLGGAAKNTSGAVDRARGGAIIRKGPGHVAVEFWNRTPGIEDMDAKHHFVDKAIAVRIVDMQAYIDRKRREAWQKISVKK